MPRTLHVVTSRVPSAKRTAALARARRTRDIARAVGVHYWVFAGADDPTTWMEFVEAGDAGALRLALRQLQPTGGNDSIFCEVELD